ncbi:MAG: response regulator [Eubacterium sp.]|nr:response regulator [Eubacterium sp.]
MYKVIIVDDEPIICEGLRISVKWEEYNCEVVGTAGNGLEGLELVRELHPDIIFSDISMNNMDGLAMVAAIKSEFPRTEVCLLTGYRNFEYAQQAIKLGVTRYLLKPSQMDEIHEAIECMTNNLSNDLEEQHIEGKIWNVSDKKEKYLYENFIKNRPEVDPDSDSKIKETEANNYIAKKALEYMYDNYKMKLSLKEVSEYCYISSWHLSKLLNQYTGRGFFEIVNKIRVDEAKKLLRTTAYKVQDVADMVGFVDVAHFSRIFKNYEGIAPSEYRHQ